MDLVLWRHCEAAPGVPDDTRPLTRDGEQQARTVALWLTRALPSRVRILVSPALRAQQTAQALGYAFETCDDVGTSADVARLLEIVRWPDAPETVLVVGHQPTLGQTVSRLVDGDEAGRSMAPGAVCWLTSNASGGATIGADVTPGALMAEGR
jgi:phosphohistidine phosphatase